MKKTAHPGALRANRPLTLAKQALARKRIEQKNEMNQHAICRGYTIPYPELLKPEELDWAAMLRETIESSRRASADTRRASEEHVQQLTRMQRAWRLFW